MRAVSGKAPVDGAINMPMPTVLVRYLQGIAAKHTDLPASAMLALPELLSNPMAVIPHEDGGYRMVLEAKSVNGEPIVAGISLDGRIQTVTPIHDADGQSGGRRPAEMVSSAVATAGAKIYARNKEALTEIRASRGVPIGSQGPNQSASTGAAPALIALHRSPRDTAIVGRLTPEWTTGNGPRSADHLLVSGPASGFVRSPAAGTPGGRRPVVSGHMAGQVGARGLTEPVTWSSFPESQHAARRRCRCAFRRT
ncbi:MAG: hypothetical protein L6Q69_20380 [Zoogloea sp.]|nr:hypothetical protein [Zoogloea sp.]